VFGDADASVGSGFSTESDNAPLVPPPGAGLTTATA
jgi:hypothetical protein